MEYINLTITQLAEAAYRRSTMPDRGVWLTLLGYCVQQENGGRIEGAQGWTEWDCQQVLGIPAKDLEGQHHLWRYDEGDLVVEFYPLDKQREVQAKRRAGKRGGLSSGEARAKQSASTASSTPSTEGEGKDKDKGKEGEDGQKPHNREQLNAYARDLAVPQSEADKFFDHFEANGWRQGGRTPLRSWRASFRNWVRRAGDFAPEKNRLGSGAPGDNPNSGLEIFNGPPPGDEPAAAAGGAR